jgi:type VI secretion system protein ImpJ
MKFSYLPQKEAGASRSKVVWSEGMYLRPQHFQQFERYIEDYVQQRSVGLQGAFWGFLSLEIDPAALTLGKVALSTAQGVFPDGTPFLLTGPDNLPAPLDIPADAKDELVVLAWPIRRADGEDTIFEEQVESLARYGVCTREIADSNAVALGPATVQIARARLKLVRASELRSEWQALGLLRVVERRSDNQLVLDKHYIPPMLIAGQHPVLGSYLGELHGLLEQRGDALAASPRSATFCCWH